MQGKLAKAVVLSLALGFSWSLSSHSAAAAVVDDEGNKSTQEKTILIGGEPFAKAYYFEKGTSMDEPLKPLGDNEEKYFASVNGALAYWKEILGNPTAGTPDIYIYSLEKGDDKDASAYSATDENNSNKELANYFLKNEYSVEEGSAAIININTDKYAWNFNELSVLPQGSTASLTSTVVHEMFHALGVSANSTDDLYAEKKKYNAYYELDKANTTTFEKHLYDMYGHNLGESKDIYAFDIKNPPEEIVESAFYVRTDVNMDNMDYSSYGGVYFTGKHVKDVLTVNGEIAEIAWPDEVNKQAWPEDEDKHLPPVKGIPVNSVEPDVDNDDFEFELSHFELQNSLQSHQNYRNWNIPMEAELAAMQDMGFDIERRKFYGYSIYNSGITYENPNPFYAWKEGKYVKGEANKENYGIGLHIYGSNNDITQKADLLADGNESIGIRVDGSQNSLTIAKDTVVTANGINGRGINFSYGKEHVLNVEGTVKALGQDGIALGFDFGDNMLGNKDDYRGSYINVLFNDDYEGTEDTNSAFNNVTAKDDDYMVKLDVLNGALVSSVDISGTVEGNGAAIYMSENALVDAIYIKSGAAIKGDIISDWSPTGIPEFLDDMAIVEGNILLPEDKDGLTKLQFEGEALSYDGNIESNRYDYASIIMNVMEGATLNYGGEASIDSVNVMKGAILQGGVFKLDKGAIHIREGFASDSGILTNEGMISAALPNGEDTVLSIEGNVKNEGGSFGFIGNVGNNMGRIEITGDLDGNKTLAVNPNGIYLPGDSYDISNLVTVNKEAIEFEDTVAYKQGILEAVYSNDNKQLSFETSVKLNDEAYEMMNLTKALAKANQNDKALLVNNIFTKMDEVKFNKALKSIKGKQTVNSSAVMQQSNTIHNALGMRLSQVNRAKMVHVDVPVPQLEETKEPLVQMGMPITVQPEYSMWAKINRNKGVVNAESDYKTDAYSIGWDKQVSKDWRFGFLGSYAKGKFEADTIRNDIEDYRLGVYGGYNKGAAEALVYADYGWGKNKLNRGLSNGLGTTKAKYDSNIMEIGAEYKYDLQHDNNKTWHVAPYGNLQVNRYSQKAYKETGADPFNQNVDKLNNTYVGLEAGVDLERRFANGSAYGMRVGYRRGLTGVEPKQNYHYAADPAHRYTNHGEADKNKLVLSLNGEVQTAPNWSISAEAGYERGKKGHGYSGEITLKYTW